MPEWMTENQKNHYSLKEHHNLKVRQIKLVKLNELYENEKMFINIKRHIFD
jgi:hypothetical protein